jgi:hypothetical protein
MKQYTSLSSSMERRLTAYAVAASAAGVGLLTAAQPAEAKIIYTDVKEKVPLRQMFPIDLNHDGITDIQIWANQKDIKHATMPTTSFASAVVYPGNNNAVVGITSASALNEGAVIGPNSPLANRIRAGMGGFATQSDEGWYWGPWANKGEVLDHRYVGVQFTVDGQLHYGWARFNMRVYEGHYGGQVNLRLTGYAYETVPNKPITAGATGADDAPAAAMRHGSLGALAAGATR